jgi:hypothetical protein
VCAGLSLNPEVNAISVRTSKDYNGRMALNRIRLFLALALLLASIALLIWGFWPAARERHILPIVPSEMTLPTPSSFNPGSWTAA